jgi:phenylpropionate dioxygenase-like ring-hydroxylating dioxygenase large terminal subunit
MGAEQLRFDSKTRDTLTVGLGLGTDPVSLDIYHTQSFFEAERERIFKRAWIMMAREEELPEPGSYVVKELRPTGVSALITRAKSGKVQAFHNTCAHRGSQVVREPAGKASRFVCPYHRWTYTNEGRLAGITDEANFFDIDKADCGLTKIATATWEGWVFVNLQDQPEVSLEEFLGPLKDHLSGFEYRGAANPVVFTAELDANWKVVSDAFIETYHIPFIHPETIGTTFASRVNPFARLLDAKLLGAHRAVSMFGNPEYQLNPRNKVEAIAGSLAEKGSVISAATVDEVASYLSHPAVNPTQATHWSMDVNQIFPHTQIDSGPGGFWTHQFWPVSPTTSFYEGRFYMTEARSMTERFLQELYISRVAEVVLEDLVNVGRTQTGINSGGKRFMQLQDSEVAIRHSVEQCIKWVEAQTVREALA